MVEGSVVLSGDQARISVQLIEAGTDKTLWAESYTRCRGQHRAVAKRSCTGHRERH